MTWRWLGSTSEAAVRGRGPVLALKCEMHVPWQTSYRWRRVASADRTGRAEGAEMDPATGHVLKNSRGELC